MSGPAVIIRLELEAAPMVYVDSLDETETVRLEDWLAAKPGYAELLQHALELQAAA